MGEYLRASLFWRKRIHVLWLALIKRHARNVASIIYSFRVQPTKHGVCIKYSYNETYRWAVLDPPAAGGADEHGNDDEASNEHGGALRWQHLQPPWLSCWPLLFGLTHSHRPRAPSCMHDGAPSSVGRGASGGTNTALSFSFGRSCSWTLQSHIWVATRKDSKWNWICIYIQQTKSNSYILFGLSHEEA